MIATGRAIFIVPLLIAALLLPKVSAVALHLHPSINAAVICTGSGITTIYLGADGRPVEVQDTHGEPCTMFDPNDRSLAAYEVWTKAPRCYRPSFVNTEPAMCSQAARGLLPDPRGPPVLI